MAPGTQEFRVVARKNYRGVQVDILEGHIHQFKATFIAAPLPTNHRAFPAYHDASKVRADPSMNLSVTMKLFEAAGDPDGNGQLSEEVKRDARETQAEREGRVKVTASYKLAPGVKAIIHAFHPKFPRTEDAAAMDKSFELLRNTYTAIFAAAYDQDNYVPGMKIALARLGTALPDWRSPQPDGTIIALTAIRTFIDSLIIDNDDNKRLPAQIAIILPPPEGDDVREDKRDEEFRFEIEKHYATELPKILKKVATPSTGRPPAQQPPVQDPVEKFTANAAEKKGGKEGGNSGREPPPPPAASKKSTAATPKSTDKKTAAQNAKEEKAKKDIVEKKDQDAVKETAAQKAKVDRVEKDLAKKEKAEDAAKKKADEPRAPETPARHKKRLEAEAVEKRGRLENLRKDVEELETNIVLQKEAERQRKAAEKKATTNKATDKTASAKKAVDKKAPKNKEASTTTGKGTGPSSSEEEIPLAHVARATGGEPAKKKAAAAKSKAAPATKTPAAKRAPATKKAPTAKTPASTVPARRELPSKAPAKAQAPKAKAKATKTKRRAGTILDSDSDSDSSSIFPSPTGLGLRRETRARKVAGENSSLEKRARDNTDDADGSGRTKRSRNA
ncbi:hypothetical protein IFR05_006430 [Cadophora sp. M221]|nr:hypothetical protein IFR05_006430 [Cadophora sp. M221]